MCSFRDAQRVWDDMEEPFEEEEEIKEAMEARKLERQIDDYEYER